MRLLTHNLLACNAKTCITTSNNFPLKFSNVSLELIEADWNEDFIRGFVPKIEWNALVSASRELGDTSLPDQQPDFDDPMLDEGILKALHHVLLEIHVMEGEMRCPNCDHLFRIKNGIPNMLLADHEIQK
ncbi:Trm112p-domain-containing protein [Tilletiaria anomala UBC 951]|uniref:Trm112p-domain-containing protein n=1 Tax=Tilletiaria anomala (strain ATCC 24038 / CBS 436.72 / UBC 951) TaxID=1037660 RepID=A0A066VDT3_TILAU|nr:Trm112p-domain-containing protein [Tilletiaria anomala UBC 951]KDN38458.1 Trm112p-domain-containing protein [Tilletiaria anomala UBC 951]